MFIKRKEITYHFYEKKDYLIKNYPQFIKAKKKINFRLKLQDEKDNGGYTKIALIDKYIDSIYPDTALYIDLKEKNFWILDFDALNYFIGLLYNLTNPHFWPHSRYIIVTNNIIVYSDLFRIAIVCGIKFSDV